MCRLDHKRLRGEEWHPQMLATQAVDISVAPGGGAAGPAERSNRLGAELRLGELVVAWESVASGVCAAMV